MNHLMSAAIHKSSASSSCVAKPCNVCIADRLAQEGDDEMCGKNLAIVPPTYNGKYINNPLNFTRRDYCDRLSEYRTIQQTSLFANRPVNKVKQQSKA